ncbi:hypothetical protein QJS10_CPB20g01763 [Acorus calamus]|uniref:RNA-binding S4 domain-containing protein n=1 Tax=Acorus calamus TaxID=4465 RepID=A0AAV9C8S4_ACOCL|nr:hypothetical protein QJS10_CPB20g01763 [Acorus calamus]
MEVVVINSPGEKFAFYDIIIVLEEEGVEVLNASFSVLGDKVFYTVHSLDVVKLKVAREVDLGMTFKFIYSSQVIGLMREIQITAKRASSRRDILHTDFLTPPALKEAMSVLEKLADVNAIAQGGYPQAERCRLSVGHPDVMTVAPYVIAALRSICDSSIRGNFEYEPCSHGDFLGAILGTGIVRDKLGDILLQSDGGAHVVVVPELVDFLVSALDKVGNVSVSCQGIPLLALEYEPPRTKSFKTIEASLRVDALASAGFKISRSKLVDLISSRDVRINWTPVAKNGATLKTGDLVSVSGKGRLKAN